jgi:hypothetical protein
MRVLEDIEDAVEKRLPAPDPEPRRKRDRLSTWVRNKTTDAKRRYKDPDELAELRRKLQNVVDGFKVCFLAVLLVSDTEELFMCAQVSALVRLELNSLKNQHDMNAVLTLATRMIEDQKLRDAKREAEAGE